MSTQPSGVVVVGSVNVDLMVSVARRAQPGETVLGRTMTVMPGGKGGNQAVAAAKLGARTIMIGAVGQDAYSEVALAGLRSAGVDLTGVQRTAAATGVAIVEVDDDGENSIVVIPGANGDVTTEMVTLAADVIADAGVLVVQGELPAGATATAVGFARGRVLINLAPVIGLERSALLRADPLVVNEHEGAGLLAQLTGTAAPSDPAACARALLECGFRSVVVTLGAAGALLATAAEELRVSAPSVPVVDTTGAGDAFVGALAARLVDGDTLSDAVRVAVHVGAFAVGTRGAQSSYPSLEAVVALGASRRRGDA